MIKIKIRKLEIAHHALRSEYNKQESQYTHAKQCCMPGLHGYVCVVCVIVYLTLQLSVLNLIVVANF